MPVQPDHGQVVLRVLLHDFALPGAAACALEGHEPPERVVDDVAGRDQVARAVVLPGHEAGAELLPGEDREDALEDPLREWREVALLGLDRLHALRRRAVLPAERVHLALQRRDLREARVGLGLHERVLVLVRVPGEAEGPEADRHHGHDGQPQPR